VTRVNGVTKPTGVIGMTVLIEGNAFGDAKHGKVWFEGAGGTRIQAVIADSAGDWANEFIVTSVPAGTPNASAITVETATGSSTSIAFSLITGATFSRCKGSAQSSSRRPMPLRTRPTTFSWWAEPPTRPT
jgi:hypothetical protein